MELIWAYIKKSFIEYYKCRGRYYSISSLRFHNGLSHLRGFRDNQAQLNHIAIRQQLFVKFNYSLKIIFKRNCFLIALWFNFSSLSGGPQK